MKCFNIIISVHGDSKGFRFEVMQEALKSGINGYIQRMGGNNFKIVAEGDEENIENFINWLDGGFHWTKIVEGKIEEAMIENFASFDMRQASQAKEEVQIPQTKKKNISLSERFRELLKSH